jgi:hypothetical protein
MCKTLGLISSTTKNKKRKKEGKIKTGIPVVSATWEAEVGGSLEPSSLR